MCKCPHLRLHDKSKNNKTFKGDGQRSGWSVTGERAASDTMEGDQDL